MISENEVIQVYKGLLNRQPENHRIIKQYVDSCNDLSELLIKISNSLEFKNKFYNSLIPSKVLVFVHIPKTAGTFLRTGWLFNNIRTYFWSDEMRAFPTISNFVTSSFVSSSYEMLGGHLHLSQFLKFPTNQPRVFVSVIRRPIDRVISFYNHVKYRDQKHPMNEFLQNKTLYDVLKYENLFSKSIKNEQLAYLFKCDDIDLDRLTNRDSIIIGKQESIDDFIRKVDDVFGFTNKAILGGDRNAAESDYKTLLMEEANADYAIEMLGNMLKHEQEFFDSFDSLKVMNLNEYTEVRNNYKFLWSH
ncbi:sulfotransferase family 2 domain-containing protein [Paraglaciecola sp. L1A13]|uniref:sulfotransferase family 2 domain-containing protein n=1 Tax=Paraglaciecola sp. L1A13 TaxID=2686359 RepID=UPI00131DF089|nr:sulfotransferase family 2 domain-containing protein [Paraglaciecola sp. L1A13]